MLVHTNYGNLMIVSVVYICICMLSDLMLNNNVVKTVTRDLTDCKAALDRGMASKATLYVVFSITKRAQSRKTLRSMICDL
jgi:hypothetical protein